MTTNFQQSCKTKFYSAKNRHGLSFFHFFSRGGVVFPPPIPNRVKLSPTFLYFGAYLGRFPTFFNMFGQYTDNLARKMGTPITHTTHIRWLHIRKKQSTHIYIWTLPRCPYLILTPFSSLHMWIQNIHAFFYKKLVYKKLGSKIYVKLQ